MKIETIKQTASQSVVFPAHEQAAPKSVSETSFSRQLSTLSQERYQAYIQEMMEEIGALGERIAKHADLSDFHRYRERIRRLLEETVSNGFAFRKYRKFDTMGRSRTFAIIQCINEKLDEMLKALLSTETDHIALLSSVEDIRGMLVDLLM